MLFRSFATDLLSLAEQRQRGIEGRVRRGDLSEIEAADNERLVVRRRVLLVEDNDGMRRIAKKQLSDLGYEVVEADRASVALEILEAGETVDLVETGESEIAYVDDLENTIYTPLHIKPDRGATSNPKSMIWIMRETYEDIAWVQDQFERDEEGFFPEQLELIGSAEGQGTTSPLYWWERMKDILDTPGVWAGIRGRPDTAGGGFAPHQTMVTAIAPLTMMTLIIARSK